MSVKKFLDFFQLKESISYGFKHVKDSDDSCVISVTDITSNPESKKNRAILFNSTGGSALLSYVNKAGEELDSIEIPLSIIKTKKGENGKVSRVSINKYKNLEDHDTTEDLIDDFIEGFANYLTVKNGQRTESTRCDIEILLDLLGIPDDVDTIKRKDRDSWEAVLKNKSLVDLKKRNKHDLFGSFKIYKTKDSTIPCLHIDNKGESKKTSFNFDDDPSMGIEEPIGLSELKSKNPYYDYLINRCTGRDTKTHKDGFVNYFIETLKNNRSNNQNKSSDNPIHRSETDDSIRRMRKALSTFLPNEEIESIYFRNQN
jgi:hypothetical protein